jgi:hypothetical protein
MMEVRTMRELITHEELMRILAAIQSEQEPSQATLQAAAEDQPEQPLTLKLPEPIDLEILVDPGSSDTILCLTGGEKWRGALVQCQWESTVGATSDKETTGSLHIFLLMPTEASLGQYQCIVTLKQHRLETIPSVARIVPRYADPKELQSRLQSAVLKPSAKELIGWIDANLRELEDTRHRDQWMALRQELSEGRSL